MWSEESRATASKFSNRFGLDHDQIMLLCAVFSELRELPAQEALAARIASLGVESSMSDYRHAMTEPGLIVSELMLTDDEYARYATYTRTFRRRSRSAAVPEIFDAARAGIAVAIIMGRDDQAQEILYSGLLDRTYPVDADRSLIRKQAVANLMAYLNDPSEVAFSWWVKLTPGMFWFYDED